MTAPGGICYTPAMQRPDLLYSRSLQILVTLLASGMYVIVLGLCLAAPSLWIASHTATFIEVVTNGSYTYWYIVRFAMVIAVSIWIFHVWGVLVMGGAMRLAVSGIKPGRYRVGSLNGIRWMFASGLYGIASHLVLPLVRNTFFLVWFYRLMGAEIGRNAQLNSYTLPDAYLLKIGENVVIGARAEISCHIFQGNFIILEPTEIGDNTLIGAHAYISPGVSIGKNCVLGVNSMIRRGTVIPDGSRLGIPAAVSLKRVREFEKEEGTQDE